MLKQTPGTIYLADQRGVAESPEFRRHSTLSFGPYQHEHRPPVGRLYAFNEEVLAGGHQQVLPVAQASWVLTLPITGDVAVALAGEVPTLVGVGTLHLLPAPAGSAVELTNAYETDAISLVQLWLAGPVAGPSFAQRLPFAVEALQNQLLELTAPLAFPLPFRVSLGQFEGRREAGYQLQKAENKVFIFVLAGAFEVAGRLLHEKDGLALWDIAEVELEALSNHALVLLVELLA